MRWDPEVGSVSLFPVASLTFLSPPTPHPIQLALSSSGAYSEEMKREMGEV